MWRLIESNLFWFANDGRMLTSAFGRQELFLVGKLKKYNRRRCVRNVFSLIEIGILCDEGIQFFRSDLLAKLLKFSGVLGELIRHRASHQDESFEAAIDP